MKDEREKWECAALEDRRRRENSRCKDRVWAVVDDVGRNGG